MNKIYWYILASFVFISLGVGLTEARRGGSSGGRARSSSSRSSSSTRSSSSVRSTRYGVRSTYRGPSYTQGSWKTAAAVGTLYGLASYKRRRRYLDSPDSDPTVCFNEKNLRNGTYGYFICPEEGQDDDMTYCCGDEDAQRCCTYTDASAVGRIIGIVIGVLALCTLTGVLVYCLCIKRKILQRNKSSGTSASGMGGIQQTANPTYNQQYSGFQYNNTPGAPPYPSTVDGTNVYATINDDMSHSSPQPIGFEDGKQPLPQNDVSAPPPYTATPYSDFQATEPVGKPPAYDNSNM